MQQETFNIRKLFYLSTGLVLLFVVAEFALVTNYIDSHNAIAHSISAAQYAQVPATLSAALHAYESHAHFLQYISIALLILSLAGVGGLVFRVFRPFERNIASTLSQMNLLKTVATAANESVSLSEGLQTSINSICEYTGWAVGHVYLFSGKEKKLVSLNVWHLSDVEKYAIFREVSTEMRFASGEGFVGEVFADATPMWILDVADSNVYLRKEAAMQCGLKAAFAFPIFIGRKPIAVIEFYSPEAHIPSEELLSTMGNIGRQLGQIIERSQFKEHAKLLETVITSANDGIIITNADQEIVFVNQAFSHTTGYAPEEAIGRSPRFLQGEQTDPATLDKIRTTLSEGKPFRGELLNYSKEGKHYWLDIP